MTFRQAMVWAGGTAAAVNFTLIVGEYLATSPRGTDVLQWGGVVLVFPLLLALVIFLISLPFMLFESARALAFRIGIAAIAYAAVAITCFVAAGQVRMLGMEKATRRAQQLVDAIRAYEHELGRPPMSLTDLIPTYIPSVPPTGMAAYPTFEYESLADTPINHSGNRWILYVSTPSGPINWDMLLYLPNQRYPARGYGGSLRRLGKWAYVHE